jgi:hypothetical protein
MSTVIRMTPFLLLVASAASGCATGAPLRADLAPLELRAAGAPAVLQADHFKRDTAGSVSEEDLRRILAAPVFLEEKARIGVVQVACRYEPQTELPLAVVPGRLGKALEASGLFEAATEVSTDWPADSGVSGLRELAARYRSGYLLLYRHRFVERFHANAWAWLYPTIIGLLVAPGRTLETAGVLEATLFDVKTGTLLFTVFERVRTSSSATVWHTDLKVRAMQERLLENAAARLGEEVVAKLRRLARSRPRASGEGPVAARE